MVGDDVTQDINGATSAGIGHAILVRTGKYLSGDEDKLAPTLKCTTLVLDSIVEAVDYILYNSAFSFKQG